MKYYYKESSLSKRRKGKFPDSNSYQDLVFRFYLKKGGGSGYLMYDGSSLVVSSPLSQPAVVETKQRLLNVSYDIRYAENSSIENFQHQHISAEGVYDTETGSLCLIACREVNISSDCKILVTAQFASLDSKVTQHFQGKIKSLREKSDPLFFETLEIASYEVYIDQVDESIWRMDLESTMALISMMLSCVFIIVQLFHVKKVPEALPAMSITMIVVLALGYMTPLVLNFETLFKNSNKQTVQFSGGGWLELVVRAVIRARGVAAPLNPAYTQGEFEFYLSDSEPRLLVTNAEGNTAAQAVGQAGTRPRCHHDPPRPRRPPGPLVPVTATGRREEGRWPLGREVGCV